MQPPNLTSIGIVKDLASALNANDTNAKFAGLPKSSLRGTVVSVEDPEKRGRVKVVFDDMNPDIPQVTGAGEWSEPREGEQPDVSHWIDVSPSFKGRQPPGLVGKRVNINASNGQYQYALLQDVLHDPENLAGQKGKDMKMPDNSSMTRLPIYPSGGLPPAGVENHGCMVVEENGPMDSDWVCVCLKRQGQFLWVRHVDLAHGHAGENDGIQPPDTDGDGEFPVEEQTVWDYVFPTSVGEMQKYSRYGTNPRPNPLGGQAKWYSPPN
jgi:hypothetical protein